MSVRVPMIEDDPSGVNKALKRIEKESENQNYPLNIVVIQPKDEYSFLDDIDWTPELVLIDYDYSQRRLKYTGKSVAGIIDDRFPDIPRILVTRKEIVREKPNISVDVPFDTLIYKGEFTTDSKNKVKLMISLIKNFKKMSDISISNRKWNSFLDLIDANSDEIWSIQDCSPPVVHGNDNNIYDAQWNPHTLTKWILGTMFKYPGLVYDSLYASAFLGISEESFIEISEFINAARYDGIYSDLGNYWWKDRLRFLAIDLILDSDLIPDISRSFSKAFLENQGGKLKPSICCTSQEIHADKVCHILRAPVMTRYSFVYKPDIRPKGMDKARVSFKAIRTSDKLRMGYLEEGDRIEAQAIIDSSRESE